MNPSLIQAIISLVPGAEVVVRGEGQEAVIEWIKPSVAPVTREEIDAELARLIAQVPFEECKAKAKTLIADVDFSQYADVNLTNKADFTAYRAILRDLILNPVAEPVWPVKPIEIWS